MCRTEVCSLNDVLSTAISAIRGEKYFMKVVITGGGGFLGSQLCQKLLANDCLLRGDGKTSYIDEIVLFDVQVQPRFDDARVRCIQGDMGDRDSVFAAVGDRPATAIFHLASMVSGECELRFDDAMRVNLDGGRFVLEAARAIGSGTKVIFASSMACYGGPTMTNPCSDATKPLPQTTYGTTKAICELLINDYTRKGWIDGRSVRLPTVIIRPGKPNAAASSWASGMFREPLHGQDCYLPIHRTQHHPMTSYRTVTDSFIAVHNLPSQSLGVDRALQLPAHSVSPIMAADALSKVSSMNGAKFGEIVDAFDPKIQAFVDNWAVAVDGSRAVKLGVPTPPPLEVIVQNYIEDFVG